MTKAGILSLLRSLRHTSPRSKTPAEAVGCVCPYRTVLSRFSGQVILDAFCGYGGNTIQFALHNPGSVVMGIDNAPDHVEMTKYGDVDGAAHAFSPDVSTLCRHNARVYGVHKQMELICGDVLDCLTAMNGSSVIDKIFLSPPWGGPAYIQKPVRILSSCHIQHATVEPNVCLCQVFALSDLPIPGGTAALLTAATNVCPDVALFLPKTTDRVQVMCECVQLRSTTLGTFLCGESSWKASGSHVTRTWKSKTFGSMVSTWPSSCTTQPLRLLTQAVHCSKRKQHLQFTTSFHRSVCTSSSSCNSNSRRMAGEPRDMASPCAPYGSASHMSNTAVRVSMCV